MNNRSHAAAFGTILFLLLGAGSPVRSQVIALPVDAEYQGALIDKSIPIQMYANGRLLSGTLKTDYSRDGYVFSAGTGIVFFEDGRVSRGTLKVDVMNAPYTFAAGAVAFHANGKVQTGTLKVPGADANLTIPANSTVTLNADGKVSSISNIAGSYSALGRLVRGNVSLAFDAGNYRLTFAAMMFQPQLVARLVTKPDVMGSYTSVPVVVPALTQMDLRGGSPGEPYDRWTPISQKFTLNGMDFGVEPVLFIRDMRLVRVQVRQAVTINGRAFKPNDIVWLTEAGELIP